jgi:hypothetical protein
MPHVNEPMRPQGVRIGVATGAALWLSMALALQPASAQATQVFHSPADNGAPAAGSPTIAEGGVQSVFLYVDGGALASAGGTVCDTGQGDEVCGFSLTLTGLGGLTLNSFSPDGAADLVVNQSTGQIVINGLDPVAPTPGPNRVGELFVNAATGGSVEMTGAEVIGADLQSEIVPTSTLVTVPEPSAALGWASGLALLGALRGRRATR